MTWCRVVLRADCSRLSRGNVGESASAGRGAASGPVSGGAMRPRRGDSPRIRRCFAVVGRGFPLSRQICYTPPFLRTGTDMLAIRLPAEVENRLAALAQATGRTKTFYAREAILRHLEDLEDLYLAERRLRDIREGKERALSLEEVMATQWP